MPTSFKITLIRVTFPTPNASEALANLFLMLRSRNDACTTMKQMGNVTPNKNTAMDPIL